MEFAIAQGFDLGRLTGQVPDLALSTVDLSVQRCRVGALELASTRPTAATPDGTRLIFAGHVAIANDFVHDLLEPDDATVRRVVESLLAGNEPDGGLYAAARLEPPGKGVLRIDPLGQYPVYYFRRGRDFIVSNNPHFVDATARASGLHLTRSLVPVIDSMAFGGPFLGATHIDDVRWLLPGEWLRFDEHGLEVLEDVEAPVRADDTEVAELTDQLVSSLRSHVEALASACPNAVAVTDLTGGADSRAVMAVVTATEAFPDLTARCFTRYPNPDANVAGLLMERRGLDPAPYPFADRGGEVRGQIRVIESSAYWHGGARDAVGEIPFTMRDLVHFSGYFGGVGGAIPGFDYMAVPDRRGKGPFNGPIDAHFQRIENGSAGSLLTRETLASLRDRMRTELSLLAERGFDRPSMRAEIYLRSRCKAHFGFRSAHLNAAWIRPDILASPALAKLRRAMAPELSMANKVILDVLLATGPDLAMAPMANSKWNERVVPPELRDLWRSMEVVTSKTPCLSANDGKLWRSMRVPAAKERPAAQLSERARAAVVPKRDRFGEAPTVVGNQAVLEAILEAAGPRHSVWDHFDRNSIIRCVRADPGEIDDAIYIVAMGRAAAGMVWALGKESTEQVVEEHSARVMVAELERRERDARAERGP